MTVSALFVFHGFKNFDCVPIAMIAVIVGFIDEVFVVATRYNMETRSKTRIVVLVTGIFCASTSAAITTIISIAVIKVASITTTAVTVASITTVRSHLSYSVRLLLINSKFEIPKTREYISEREDIDSDLDALGGRTSTAT